MEGVFRYCGGCGTCRGKKNPNLERALNIGGSGSDFGRAIATDSSGNVFITGNFSEAIDIDKDGSNDLSADSSEDSYIAKLDSTGNLLWAKNMSRSTMSIATDSSGNVLLTGRFQNSIDIDKDGNIDLTPFNSNSDGYAVKIDRDGNLVWAQNIGGSSTDQGWGIATDSSGNVLLTGSFQNAIDIDSDGNNDLTSNGGTDSYIVKLDSDGNFLWAESIGASENDGGNGIAADSNGNVLVTGRFTGSIDIDSDGSNDLTSDNNDSYAVKFDSDGNLVWAKSIGDRGNEVGYGIVADSNNNVLLAGEFRSTVDIDSDGNNDLTSKGANDGYVVKLDSDGNFLWAESIGGDGSGDASYEIATDSNSNVLVTGIYRGTVDIDKDGNNDLTGNGEEDSYAAKFDSNGSLVWAENIGGSGSDIGWGIATDSSNNIWAIGEFQNAIDIDLDGSNDLTANGNSDSYVIKFSENGGQS